MKPLLILLLCCAGLPAAISTSTVWEVRPTVGAATNGGGFVQGATGTDMSQFDNKNAAACTSCQSSTVNISTTDGVTAGTTTVTSLTGNYSQALIGNIVPISGGTGSVAIVWKEVMTVPSATSFTVDSSTGLTAGTGVTIGIGGALDDPTTALLSSTAGNIIFVKATGTLDKAARITLNNSISPAYNTPPNQLIGYHTTRFDCDNLASPCASRPTIRATAGGFDLLYGNGFSGWHIRNFILDCNSQAACTGMYAYVYWSVRNVKVTNFTSYGIYAAQNDLAVFLSNEITGGTGCTFSMDIGGGTNFAANNYIHNNDCDGINISDNGKAIGNLVTNNTGATTDGIRIIGGNSFAWGNTVYGSGRDNISINEVLTGQVALNNVLAKPGRYNLISGGGAGAAAFPQVDGNCYWLDSGTANRFQLDDTGSVNPINALHYTNTKDVILSADPFTNAAGNNYTLSAAGAACKGTALPASIPGATGTGYGSFGVFQPAVSGGGSSFGSQQ